MCRRRHRLAWLCWKCNVVGYVLDDTWAICIASLSDVVGGCFIYGTAVLGKALGVRRYGGTTVMDY